MRNTFDGVCLDQRIVKQLPFLIGHIGNQKAEEDVQLLNLTGKHGLINVRRIQQIGDRSICPADLHDVDTVRGCRGDLNELTADVVAGTVEFVAFQRCDDKGLDVLPPHTERHQLHRKGLTGTGGTEDRHVCVFIDAAIEDVHNNQRIVMLVDPEQNAVIIAHLKARERITACHTGGQDVAFGSGI